MSFHPQPFLLADSILRGRKIQIRPAPGRVYQGSRFKLFVGGDDTKRAWTGDASDRDLLAGIHTGAFCGSPERSVEVEAGNAGGGRVHCGSKSVAIQENTGSPN